MIINLRILLSVFLCTALIIGVTSAYAAQSDKNSYVASEKQVELVKKMWGEQISKGMFLETFFPKALEEMHDDIKKELYKMDHVWPDLNEARAKNQQGNTEDEAVIQGIYVVGHDSNLSETGTSTNWVEFDSGSRVWIPTPTTRIPFMEVTSYLYKNDTLVTFVYNYGSNVNSISAEGKSPVISNGTYEVVGVHAGTTPDGPYACQSYEGPAYYEP